jgi:hypothetical protein
VTIGERDLGIWDSHTGGEIDSEESKYRPGGLAAQISLGGSVTVNNVTVGRLYLLERDHQLVPFLLGQVGKGDFIVTKQPLGVDGVAFGKPTVYRGKLKQVTLPEHDSESSDPAKIELEMSAATASQV